MKAYHYLPIEYGPIRNGNCNIHRSGGTLPAMRMHYHDFYQLYFIEKGQLLHKTPSRQTVLRSGDCFIIPPNFPHSIAKGAQQPQFYAFSFRRDFLSEEALRYPPIQALLDGATPNPLRLGLSLSGARLHTLEQLLRCCLQEFEQQNTGWEWAVQGMLWAVLVQLSRSCAPQRSELPPQPAIQDCICYIDEHFREQLSLPFLLDRFHFSDSGFYRIFRETVGCGFQQYLTRRRLEYACGLLRDTAIPIRAVAEQSGYQDYSSFFRSFCKYKGISPSQYRKAKTDMLR